MTERFPVLLIDPPWSPSPWSVKGKGRHPSAYYDTMSVQQIAAVPVPDFMAKDCAVFLWVTDQFLAVPFTTLFPIWGLTYSSVAFVWVKTARRLAGQEPLFLIADNKDFPAGQGHTTRKNAEYCLLARRGRFGRQHNDVAQVIFAPRRANSEKPDEVYERIERLLLGPYLKLFARRRRPGWEVALSPEADIGPGKRRWSADSYPGAPPGDATPAITKGADDHDR
jgi:N6-adenosine-specific RNA methylase IME4